MSICKPEECGLGSCIRIQQPETTFYALYADSKHFCHEEYIDRRDDKLRDKKVPSPWQQKFRRVDIRTRYIGGFRRVMMWPTVDVDRDERDGTELEVPDETGEAPSRPNEERTGSNRSRKSYS